MQADVTSTREATEAVANASRGGRRSYAPGTDTTSAAVEDKVLQLRAGVRATLGAGDPRATAARGVSGSGGDLPFAARIQAAFGRHDVSRVRAFHGGAAADACDTLGAHGFTLGDRVALRSGADLFTTAHEAAHVVQQRSGIALSDGMGRPGDTFERHADQVAARVVAGQSASDLLDRFAGSGRSAPPAGVQLRAYTATNDGASASIVQAVIGRRDAGEMRALYDAMVAAARSRSAPYNDHIVTSGPADSYDLVLAPESTDELAQQLEATLAAVEAESGGGGGGGRASSGSRSGSSRSGSSRERTRVASRRASVTGMQALRDTVGDFVLAAVPAPGALASGEIQVRASVDGVVFEFSFELEAEQTDDGHVDIESTFNLGVGAGTADNNVLLRAPERIAVSGTAATPAGVGSAISMAVRNKLIHLGEGPIPSPALAAIVSALGGPAGNIAVAADWLTRMGYGLFGDGGYRNPCYAWVADRIWGPGFARSACADMGEGASVESGRGGALAGNASGGEGDTEASVSGEIGYENTRIETCGADGGARTTHEDRGTIRGEVEVGPVTGSIEIQISPRATLTIGASVQAEHVDRQAANIVSVLMEGVRMARREWSGDAVPAIRDTALSAAVGAGIGAVPGGSTFTLAIELSAEPGRVELKFTMAQGVDYEGSAGVAGIEASIERGQVIFQTTL